MNAIVWSKTVCPFCIRAKELLTKHNIHYEERIIGECWTREQLLKEVPNARTVPQIFIDKTYIGGYNELVEHLSSN